VFRLDEVSKSYHGTVAVERVSLTVTPARTTVLIGPSGCGKSTLLRLLLGLVMPDAGTVVFGGTVLDTTNVTDVRRRAGYVVQQGGLFPHLTARQNVCLMANYLRWSRERVAVRLDELVALTHFPTDRLDRYPAELSGGQNQRVGLMRALMLDPEVLLLDEPLGALDPMIRFELQTDLRTLFTTLGRTVVMVTHDLAEAAYLADTIVLMRHGRVVQQGTLGHMLEEPANEFVSRFIRAQRLRLDATTAS
jgi:osmoprotectant transport system ATP-binding protein